MDIFRTALGLFAAIAPVGALPVFMAFASLRDGESGRTWPDAAVAGSTAFAVLAVAALVATPVLDFLNISAENFQLAAAVTMMPLAMRLILTADSAPPPESQSGPLPVWLVPLAVPPLASPPAVIAAMSYSARYGESDTIAAASVVLVLSALIIAAGPWIVRGIGWFGLSALGRLSGALLVVIAVELAVDGVRSV